MNTDVEEVVAGRELDARIGEMIGYEPRVSWQVLNPEGNASAMSCDTEREAREWLTETLRKYPDSWVKDYHVGTWTHWPRFSEDMGAAWKVVDAVTTKTKWYALTHRPQGAIADFTGDVRHEARAYLDETNGDREKAQALAICRAALKVAELMQPDSPALESA